MLETRSRVSSEHSGLCAIRTVFFQKYVCRWKRFCNTMLRNPFCKRHSVLTEESISMLRAVLARREGRGGSFEVYTSPVPILSSVVITAHYLVRSVSERAMSQEMEK